MDCCICLENITIDKYILKCGHIYHVNCIEMWYKKNHKCPLCRDSVFNKPLKDFGENYWRNSKKIQELIINNDHYLFKI